MTGSDQALSTFSVKKSSGDFVPFDIGKLRSSLQRSGAGDLVINQVLQDLREKVYENMSTKALYKMAYKLLKKYNHAVAARYSLKQAMLELGPSGFPFERFYAEILKATGYQVETGILLHGKCVKHEMDVVAENDTEVIFTECKYHAEPGAVSDIKIPLYIHSRFRDLLDSEPIRHQSNGRPIRCQIVTNTRFSDDAMTYGRCAGLNLISWNYPLGKGLREMIDRTGLHPITCISGLSRKEKSAILDKNIVLCKQLVHRQGILEDIGISAGRIRLILQEINGLCGTPS